MNVTDFVFGFLRTFPYKSYNTVSLIFCQLGVTAGVGLVANYFNENISEWEPLIEPVEEADHKYRPWEITLEVGIVNMIIKSQTHGAILQATLRAIECYCRQCH